MNEFYKNYRVKEYVSKMESIQRQVNLVRNEYRIWDEYNPNEVGNFYSYLQDRNFVNANSSLNTYLVEFNKIIKELDNKNIKYWNKNIDSIITNYCYFSSEDLEEFFNLKNYNLSVIINFYTGNVISKEGIEDFGKIIYRQYDSRFGNKLVISNIYNEDFKPKIEIIENNGLSQKIKIYIETDNILNIADISEIYYYLDEKDYELKRCSNLENYTYVSEEKSAYFNISISGNYSFIIEDINNIQYTKITKTFNLCNSPNLLEGMKGIYWDDNGDEKEITTISDSNWYDYSKDNLKMANCKTEDGNYYVWIPRFIFKETNEGVFTEFVEDKTMASTKNQALNGYNIQESFTQNGEITGFWIAKFQINIGNKISIKPGQTLTILSLKDAKLKCLELGSNYNLMSKYEKDAVILLSRSNDIEISNDLVHYSGGSPNENGYKTNGKYSSTNNIYGVYDLETSENEIIRKGDNNEEGRFRITIISD